MRSPPDATSKTSVTTNPRNQSDFQKVKFFIPVPNFYIFILVGYRRRLIYFTAFVDKYMIFFICAPESADKTLKSRPDRQPHFACLLRSYASNARTGNF